MTNIIYLFGHPGTGKYTIAKEIAKAGYIVCDNQLINNPIFELLQYDGMTTPVPEFAWQAIEMIRKGIFHFLLCEKNNNYVLTNCLYEEEGDKKLFAQVEELSAKRCSKFIPVKLTISKEENTRRIEQPSRKERFKSVDPSDAQPKLPLLKCNHPNLIELEVSDLSAEEAAENILAQVMRLS